MRDQRLGIEFALGNELQSFLAIATINATGLEGQILAVHIGQRQGLRLVVKRHHRDNGIIECSGILFIYEERGNPLMGFPFL